MTRYYTRVNTETNAVEAVWRRNEKTVDQRWSASTKEWIPLRHMAIEDLEAEGDVTLNEITEKEAKKLIGEEAVMTLSDITSSGREGADGISPSMST